MKWKCITILIALFTLAGFPAGKVLALDIDTLNKIKDIQPLPAAASTFNKVESVLVFVKKGVDSKKDNPKFLYEETVNERNCDHCPRHFELASSINKILDVMKKDPNLSENEEIPVHINRLKFLYYVVKVRLPGGGLKCSRYNDYTADLRPTKFDGKMQLMAEDVFKFNSMSSVQVMDPSREEILYYYRGEGEQSNIIVQAELSKKGGKFRYYNYTPTADEKNPYNLPSIDSRSERIEESPKRNAVAAVYSADTKQTNQTPSLENAAVKKEKYNFDFDPTVEVKHYIPQNVHIAKGDMEQEILGTGISVKGQSEISLKENTAKMHLQNKAGKSLIELDMKATIQGKITKKLTIPFEVRLGADDDKEAAQLNGKIEEDNGIRLITMTLTDQYAQQYQAQYRKDKKSSAVTMSVTRDYSLGPNEMVTLIAGRSDKNYVSVQHRQVIRKNITMVIDVRVDASRKSSFYYQMKAPF
ncbi:MAG: hypothetical protein H7336_12445 [Bacteriovorax sp.]|nr:hypothetical protein [Bacteriovorax sp.]